MKDNLFLDTNVVFDLLSNRDPFYECASKIITLADHGAIYLTVSALSYSTVYFLLAKLETNRLVFEKIRNFKTVVETVDLTNKIVDQSLSSKFSDFEDGLQYYSALQKRCDILITRNEKDFKHSDIPVMSPDEYLKSRIRQ